MMILRRAGFNRGHDIFDQIPTDFSPGPKIASLADSAEQRSGRRKESGIVDFSTAARQEPMEFPANRTI
jgi:hypothetical protein